MHCVNNLWFYALLIRGNTTLLTSHSLSVSPRSTSYSSICNSDRFFLALPAKARLNASRVTPC